MVDCSVSINIAFGLTFDMNIIQCDIAGEDYNQLSEGLKYMEGRVSGNAQQGSRSLHCLSNSQQVPAASGTYVAVSV